MTEYTVTFLMCLAGFFGASPLLVLVGIIALCIEIFWAHREALQRQSIEVVDLDLVKALSKSLLLATLACTSAYVAGALFAKIVH
jgi:hypothetical protein